MLLFDQKRMAFFLPNLFTSLNMGCGFLAILQSISGNFYNACLLISFGVLFDSLDGRIARLLGTSSSFGEQFDSLSDLTTFAMAPSFLFYFAELKQHGRLGLVLCFFYLLCGALRLARFNANISKISSGFFQGLPSPGAACALVGYVWIGTVFIFGQISYYIAPVYISLYAILMVSSFPFPSFKNSEWINKHKRSTFFILIILILLILLREEIMLFVVISIYVILSLIYFFKNSHAHRSIFIAESEDLDEGNEDL